MVTIAGLIVAVALALWFRRDATEPVAAVPFASDSAGPASSIWPDAPEPDAPLAEPSTNAGPQLETLALLWEGLTFDQVAALVSATRNACVALANGETIKNLTDDEDQELFESVDRALAGATDPRHQVTHLLFNKRDRDRYTDLAVQMMQVSAPDALVATRAVTACDPPQLHASCAPIRQWVQTMTSLDGDNSETWVLAAGIHYALGDEPAALAALKQAASAANTRSLFAPTVWAVFHGLDAATDLPDADRATIAFGVAAANHPSMRYARACELNRDEGNVEWISACERYFRMVMDRPADVLTRAVAADFLGLERPDPFTQLVDSLAPMAVDGSDGEAPGAPKIDVAAIAERVVVANETVLYLYLDYLSANGEEKAVAWVRDGIRAVLEKDEALAAQCQIEKPR